MTGARQAILSGGRRHFQHGPIDLVLFAEAAGGALAGNIASSEAAVARAYEAAWCRFETILEELVAELPLLRTGIAPDPAGRELVSSHPPGRPTPLDKKGGGCPGEAPWYGRPSGPHSIPPVIASGAWRSRAARSGSAARPEPAASPERPALDCSAFGFAMTTTGGLSVSCRHDVADGKVTSPSSPLRGAVAWRMWQAACLYAGDGFVTPMAAVAGAVAEAVLAAMTAAADLERAYVNNGGDIAVHLAGAARFRTLIADHRGTPLGAIDLTATDRVRGIATSGRHGRSHSLGIADSVTVLAAGAADADAAATMIANAVDLPAHPAVSRTPAAELSPDSDLGERLVVTGCAPLAPADRAAALDAGEAYARRLVARGHIAAAFLHLQGETRVVGGSTLSAVNVPAAPASSEIAA